MQNLPSIDSLWDLADPAGSEQRFLDWSKEATTHGNTTYYIVAKTQAARAQAMQGRYPEAQTTLDEIEDQLAQAEPPATLRYLLERGRLFEMTKDIDQARDVIQKAWELAQEHHLDRYAIDAGGLLGQLADDPDQRIVWHKQAVNIAEGSDQNYNKDKLAVLYHDLGWAYHQIGQNEAALNALQKALELRETAQNSAHLRQTKSNTARVMRALGRVEEALAIQRQLMREYEATGQESGVTCEEIGECLLILGEKEMAQDYFERAYRLLSQDDTIAPQRIQRLKDLSGIK